jgi:predicted DNA-binding ribbon-helix-helix protein
MSHEDDCSSLVQKITDQNSTEACDKGYSNTDREICKSGCNSTLISHNVMIDGRRTSVRLEKEMWIGLKQIARREDCSVHILCSAIAQRKRPATSLTAAIRVFVMAYYQAAATDEGHQRAGHGAGAFHATHILQKHANAPYYGLREFKTASQSPA